MVSEPGEGAKKAPVPGLLHSKLCVPPLRPAALDRRAVVEQLDSVAAPGRLVLVVAGAGWGKSTLVASWVRQKPDPDRCVWFSVDPGDDDVTCFWAYLLAGLASVDAAAFATSTRLLTTLGTSVLDDVLPALINELSALDEPVTVVIDDYHFITTDDVHRSMSLLLGHLPETLRLVLISRTIPALPTVRLRGQGRLAEITIDQLRLSGREAAELLERETGTDWKGSHVARLHDTTEGWATGLHLAALSLRAHADHPDLVIDRLTGNDRRIGEYLMSEVLTRLPHDLRTLARRSSILQRFSPALCAAVTGQPDAAQLLTRMERDQLFLVPLDNQGDWYRFHHLFADVLRRDLDRAEADVVPDLHRRAATWFAAHDLPVEAVHHGLASRDTMLAADLVATHGPVVSHRGYVDTALGWFQALGEDVCRADPRLCVARAVVAVHACRMTEMVRWADLAEDAIQRPGVTTATAHEVRVQVALTRWASASFAGDSTAARRHAEQLLTLAAVTPPPLGVNPPAVLGLSQYRAGDLRAAQHNLARAAALAVEHGDDLTAMLTLGVQAMIAARDGATFEAERLAVDAEARSHRHNLSEHFDAFYLHTARGWLSWQEGKYRHARGLFGRALELARRSPLRVETAEILTALAVTEQKLHHHRSARAHLGEARRMIEQCPDPGELFLDPRTVLLACTHPRPATPLPLSGRETEVLEAVAQGLTSGEIGARLHLSRRTIEAHLGSIYRKIGVTTRAAAIRYAFQHDLAGESGSDRNIGVSQD